MSPITTILLNCPVFDPVSSPCCLVSTSAELHLKGTKSAEDTVMCINYYNTITNYYNTTNLIN